MSGSALVFMGTMWILIIGTSVFGLTTIMRKQKK